MRYAQGSISDFSGFFTEDGAQQSFFCGKVVFTLRRYLADQNVCRVNLSTDSDDTFFVQILQRFIADIWNVSGDFFRSQLGISCFCFIFHDMQGSQHVIHQKSFVQNDSILVVVAFPGHEADEQVLAQSDFSQISGRTVSDDFAGLDVLTVRYNRSLVDAGSLIGTLELQ